ncbi:polysaccharide biosynthesis tyrosine autokinase [Geodermatophilus sp. SYSU D00758]
MELKEVLAAVRSAWWLPAVGLVIGAVAALLIGLAQTPLYTSSMRLYVSTTGSNSVADAYQGSQLSQARVASYAELVASERLTGRVVDSLDLPMTPDQLASAITARAVPDTVLLDITVTDPSPQRARDIAEALGEEFNAMVAQLETSPDSAQAQATTPVSVSVIDAPQVPGVASSPRTQRNVALGALVGLLGGVAASVVRSRRDRSLRQTEEAARLTGVPVLGTVVRDEALQRHHLFSRAAIGGVAEDLRQLRVNLQYLDSENPPKSIVVSSACPSEGTTTLVINLARVLAEAGRRVTIVDADLRRPRVTRYLGLVEGAGLTDLLTGHAEVVDVVQEYGDEDLYVLSAGPIPPNPGELLASGQMRVLIDALKEKNDVVLIDTSPLLPVADGSSLAALADGVLLAVRYGETSREELQQAKTTLDRVGARTLGLVFTVVPPGSAAESASVHRYGYESDPVTASPGDGRAEAGSTAADVTLPPGRHAMPSRLNWLHRLVRRRRA